MGRRQVGAPGGGTPFPGGLDAASHGAAAMSAHDPAAVERLFAPLLVDPAASALITDFDGTLAEITAVPDDARPVAGAIETLQRLSEVFGRVAVVSGRPVAFLVDRLASHGRAAPPCRLLGLYGLEELRADGSVHVHPDAVPWVPVVAEVVARARLGAPEGLLVEEKRLSVTLHWRRDPGVAGWAEEFARAEAAASGLSVIHGRLAVELRPPVAVDKGTTVAGLASGSRAACYLGDDLGDVPAFEALDRLAAGGGVDVVKAVVLDEETPCELATQADVRIAGPVAAMAVLRWLAREAALARG